MINVDLVKIYCISMSIYINNVNRHCACAAERDEVKWLGILPHFTSLYPQSDSCRVLSVVLSKLFYKFTWTSVLNNDLENRLAKYNIVLANRVAYISRPFNLQLLFVCIFYYMLSHWHWNDVIVAGVSLPFVFFVCLFFSFYFSHFYF